MIATRVEYGWWVCWMSALLVLCACSVDPKANSRYGVPQGKCKTPLYRGFCEERTHDANVTPPDADATSGDGSASTGNSGSGGGGSKSDAGDAGGDAGQPNITGQACPTEGDMNPCYDGPKGSDQFGNCRPGARTCEKHQWGECLRQVLPQPELCNNADDDCDDKTDEDLEAFGTCTIKDAPCGAVLSCEAGTPVCAVSADPIAEICNMTDDDCDMKVDEESDQPCATGNAGCTPDGSGGFDCKGICKAGIQHCVKGVLKSECEGQVKPMSKEVCNASGPATDDDCNGDTDDTCTCSFSSGDTQPCYNGPANTLGVSGAPCHAGMQQCSANNSWGDCTGEQGPVDETCANPNEDNDCNGVKDDVPMLGSMCTTTDPGICHTGTMACKSGDLACVAPAPVDELCNTLDDDCDSMTDEGFNLQTDENNCGTCGTKCMMGMTCCAGTCVDTMTSGAHCGGCSMPCGNGITCCGGTCADRNGDEMNCGTCGHACGNNELCCIGACMNITTNTHCGSCTNSCGAGTGCCHGTTCQLLSLCL